ncbi:MAG: hypothetical protein ICV64_00205 [Thermoleophilia bacterium]|nr:hypothetical protein [Thermoleophilia bacterium]
MLFVLWVPILILMLTFVVDVGNWFTHKRHLQLQADAGALAAGQEFRFPCTNSLIEAMARRYGGDPGANPKYNEQVGGSHQGAITLLINSKTFAAGSGPPDDTDTRPPCESLMVDVKLTEANLPWFFKLAGSFVPAINAHARVQWEKVGSLARLRPLGIRDVNPKSGAVLFVDNETGAVLERKYLTKTGTGGGLNTWSNEADPATVTMPPADVSPFPASGTPIKSGVGAVLAFSNRDQAEFDLTGDLATICAPSDVDCYDDPDRRGVVFARSWPGAATTLPVARDVHLVPGSSQGQTPACPDPYFFNRSLGSGCYLKILAKIDNLPTGSGDARVGAMVGAGRPCPAAGNLQGGADIGLTFVSGYWVVPSNSSGFAVSPDAGPVPILLCYEQRSGAIAGQPCSSNSPCAGNLGLVQRTFSGNDDFSGAMRSVQLWNADGLIPYYWNTTSQQTTPSNAYREGTSHKFFVRVNLGGAVSTSPNDPPVALRVVGRADANGNQSAVDCEQTVTLATEIEFGCEPFYKVNTRMSQPDPCNPPWANSPDMWASPQPWDCVAVKPGGSVGLFTTGIQRRVLGPGASTNQCPAPGVQGRNNWDKFGTAAWDPRDSRIVQLFMVPFGALRGTGSSELFPVIDFGTFYIRGWGGNNPSDDDPCPDPVIGNENKVAKGFLLGNFINYTVSSGQGTGSGSPCDVNAFTPCIAVLTR